MLPDQSETKTKYDWITWVVLGLCAVLMFFHIQESSKRTAWEREQALKKQAEQNKQAAQEQKQAAGQTAQSAPETPAGAQDKQTGPEEKAPAKPTAAEQTVVLENEHARFVLTSKGGGIQRAEMKQHPAVGLENELVHINRHGSEPIGSLIQGNLGGVLGLDYQIVNQSDQEVTLSAQTPEQLQILKKWSLIPNPNSTPEGQQYMLNLELTLRNQNEAGTPVNLDQFGLVAGTQGPLYQREWEQQTGLFYHDHKGFEYKDVKWFKGGIFRSPKEFLEVQASAAAYVGTANQFFASFIKTQEPRDVRVWARPNDMKLPEDAGGGNHKAITAAMGLPADSLAPGELRRYRYEVFLGPKDNGMIREIDEQFGHIMHYGFFSPVSRFLNWVLNFIHDRIFDPISHTWAWGFSIMLLTVLIRTVIWPLHNASTRSMKRMSKLQPLMKEIREKYADNPQKMNEETLKLYREYHINPAGGCLPVFFQIPIFFGFYKMLQHAVELRNQEFLWVEDLSQPDTLATLHSPVPLPFLGNDLPINLLPILMAVTMVLQMMLTPKTGDKMQQRIMMLMPLMFFFFCYNFASALALYWTTQNIFSIGQTWFMQRQPEPELKKKDGSKKTWMEKLQERAEEAQKMRQQMARQQQNGGMRNVTPDKPKKNRPPRTGG